jgi:hypothetical protein
MRNMSGIKKFIGVIVALWVAIGAARGQSGTNLLTKAQEGDWAQYVFNSQNETTPMLSVKDQQRWCVVSVVQETGVRIDEYLMMAGSRTAGLGRIADFNKPYEPVGDIALGAKIDVVSSTSDSVTVKGKTYACTKIVRKVGRAADITKGQTGWNGASTIWICPDIPVGGVVKIENRYELQITEDSKPDKIVETWLLADFGLKNWKD